VKATVAALAASFLFHSAQASAAFEATNTLHGIAFAISSPNTPTANRVTIVPSGLAIDNSPVEVETRGIVTGAEVADIDANGSPEIYIYVAEPGADKPASLIAFSANKKKSLSQIFIPALEDDPKNANGYRGHDEFAVLEGVVGRRFPIYPDDKTQTEPTGKMRQIQYKLVPGEASWMLKIDRVVEF
jgi:hypothetical protein